jgi:acetyl-CoA synthetase
MTQLYKVPDAFAAQTRCTAAQYAADYAESIRDPNGYWGRIGRRLDWITPFSRVRDVSFNVEDFHIRWYEDGALNVSANCLDRHLAAHRNRTAIIWEGDNPAESRHISYGELHADVCRLANVLTGLGGSYADVVKFTTYLVHSQDIDQFMVLRRALFPTLFAGDLYPPNTLLVVDRMVKEPFLIEVEAVASIASVR